MEQKTVLICSIFPADAVVETVEFWAKELHLQLKVELTPFNQVFQQLLDPTSMLATQKQGVTAIVLRAEEIGNAPEFVSAVQSHRSRTSLPLLIFFCPGKDPGAEDSLAAQLSGVENVSLVRSSEFAKRFGPQEWEHARPEFEYPYNDDLFIALGTLLARKCHALLGPKFKAIAVDCDNTLWTGVCAEESVVMDAGRRKLQEFLLAQREAGMLLALCSKNVEADVLNVLDRHPETLLKREHLAGLKVNWASKSSNLLALARDLNIVPDSFIFIDDNPVECAEVAAVCPGTLVLTLPEETAKIESFLDNVWAFDRASVTAEDRFRADFYRHDAERKSMREASASFEDFLAGLDLKVEIRPLTSVDLRRAAQLTQRTTQFTFSSIRRSEAELGALINKGEFEGLMVDVRDRFGAYGDVGLMLFKSKRDALLVDSFLLSCRALGRNVEFKMLKHIAAWAQSRGLQRIEIPFVASPRNEPAFVFLDGLRMQLLSDGSENGARDETYLFRTEDLLGIKEGKEIQTPTERSEQPQTITVEQGGRVDYARIATDLSDLANIRKAVAAALSNHADLTESAEVVRAILKQHPDVRAVVVKPYLTEGSRLAIYISVTPIRSPRIDGRIRSVLPNEMAVVGVSQIETDALYQEIFEQRLYLKHGLTLRDGDCIVDAGANIGFFTMFAQSFWRNTTVYAFEPVPPLFEALRLNARLYAPGARLFNCGLADRKGSATIEFHPYLTGSSSYLTPTEAEFTPRTMLHRRLDKVVGKQHLSEMEEELTKRALVTERFETPVISLSDFFREQQITRVDFLKVDVERSELNVLRGIRDEDWPMIEQVALEAHTDAIRDEVAALLSARGFKTVLEDTPGREGTGISNVYASRGTRKPPATASSFARNVGAPLLSAAQLRTFVKRKLRKVTAPLDFIFLDDSTLATLPAPAAEITDRDQFLRRPENPLQEEIAGVWKEMLGLGEVAIDENFFELGGHSLLAASMLTRLRDAFGVELRLASVFDAPTILGLSSLIEERLIQDLEPEVIESVLS